MRQAETTVKRARTILEHGRWERMEYPYEGWYAPNPPEVIETVARIFNEEAYYGQEVPQDLYDLFDEYVERYGNVEAFTVTACRWPRDLVEAKHMIIFFRAEGQGTRWGFIPQGAVNQ